MDLTREGLRQPHAFGDRPGIRLCPENTAQTAELLAARKSPLALVEAEAADLPEAAWLDLSGMSRVRNYRVSDLMIEVETGITLKALNAIIKAEGHALALSYPEDVRLIDILAEDRPGLETGRAGYPRDLVLKCEVVTADRQITHYGADVVKNVTGYDLNKLYVGSRSTLAVLTAVTLKLQAAPEARALHLQEFGTLDEALIAAQTLLSAGLPPSQCEIFPAERLNTHQQRQLHQPWQMLTEYSGDARVIAPAIEPGTAEDRGQFQETLAHARAKNIQTQLGAWPTTRMWVEVAVPAGSLKALLGQLKETAFQVMQLRPAAGLLYLQPKIPPDSTDLLHHALEELNHRVLPLGGVLKVMPGNVAERALAETFNLPADPILRNLMRQLKHRYDPGGILYSRSLPLELPDGDVS